MERGGGRRKEKKKGVIGKLIKVKSGMKDDCGGGYYV